MLFKLWSAPLGEVRGREKRCPCREDEDHSAKLAFGFHGPSLTPASARQSSPVRQALAFGVCCGWAFGGPVSAPFPAPPAS